MRRRKPEREGGGREEDKDVNRKGGMEGGECGMERWMEESQRGNASCCHRPSNHNPPPQDKLSGSQQAATDEHTHTH